MRKILFVKGQISGQWEEMWAKALQKLNYDVTFVRLMANFDCFLIRKISALSYYLGPNKLGQKVQIIYHKYINKNLIKALNVSESDVLFIYNGWDKILPDTWKLIKKKVEKIIVLLGDNPFLTSYNFNNNILFSYLKDVDLFLTVDQYAYKCLQYFNVNTILIPAGTDDELFYPMIPSNIQMKEYYCDLLFVGNGYGRNPLGYFRGHILNELDEFNLKIFGNKNWQKLFPYFPNLKRKLIFKSLTTEELNISYNCSKIFIALTNPLAVDAVHTRVFDSLASGLFVIYEHRDDCNRLFPDDLVPTFKNVNDLKEKVKYYLKNDKEREEKVIEARNLVLKKYLVKDVVKEIIDYI